VLFRASPGSAGTPQQKASSDEREQANRYANTQTCQKTSIVETLGGRIHKISMQEVSEGQRCEQHCNSAKKVKNSHVASIYASEISRHRYNFTHPREDAERSTASSTRCTETASSKSGKRDSFRASAPRKSPKVEMNVCS
jgi:hypothetical protein